MMKGMLSRPPGYNIYWHDKTRHRSKERQQWPFQQEERQQEVIEEEAFKSILSIAQRILDVYGRHETSDSARIVYTEGDLNIGSENGITDIFFRGSLVFRHDPKGEITDFYEEHGVWMDEIERVSRNIPQASSGIANKRR